MQQRQIVMCNGSFRVANESSNIDSRVSSKGRTRFDVSNRDISNCILSPDLD